MFNTEALEAIASGLRHRWGSRALNKGSAGLPASNPLPTGYVALDALLEGGIARASLVELLGAPTSGATSLALNLVAQAHAEGGDVTWLDLTHTFDALRAEACGIHLNRLLVVRPGSVVEAMSIVEDVVHGHGSTLVVVQTTHELLKGFQGHAVLARGLRRLVVPLRYGTAIVVFITPAGHTPTAAAALNEHAALRLVLERQKLLRQAGEWVGFRSRITLLKHKTLAPGQTVIDLRV